MSFPRGVVTGASCPCGANRDDISDADTVDCTVSSGWSLGCPCACVLAGIEREWIDRDAVVEVVDGQGSLL